MGEVLANYDTHTHLMIYTNWACEASPTLSIEISRDSASEA